MENNELVLASVSGAIPVYIENLGSFYECPEFKELSEAAKMADFEREGRYYFTASALVALAAQGYLLNWRGSGCFVRLLCPTWARQLHPLELAELCQQTAAVIAAADSVEKWRQKSRNSNN